MKVICNRNGGLLILPENPEDINYLDTLKSCNPSISFYNLGKPEWMGGMKIECEEKEKVNEIRE